MNNSRSIKGFIKIFFVRIKIILYSLAFFGNLLYEIKKMNLLKSDHHLIYGSSMKISDNRSRLMNQQTKRRGDHASVIAEYRSNLIKIFLSRNTESSTQILRKI